MTTETFEVFLTFPTAYRNKSVEMQRQFTDPYVGEALAAVLRVRRPGAVIDGFQIASVNRSMVAGNGMDVNSDMNAVLKYLLIVQYTFSPQELNHE